MTLFGILRSLGFALLPAAALAQAMPGVGIGTATPDVSAALEVRATGQGMLVPRLLQAQRQGITAPATGLLLYQTDGAQPGFYYNAGTPAAPAWTVFTAVGDNLGNHTATQSLNLQANALVGAGSSLGSTVGVGVRADGGLNLGQNATGNNVLLGYQAGQTLAPNLLTTQGLYNTLLGYQAGPVLTTGGYNLFSGYQSGYNATTGYYNLFLGYHTGYSTIGGYSNTFIGNESGYSNISGRSNVFLGPSVGYSNKTGDDNFFSGANSGYANLSGSQNVFIGVNSGKANKSGGSNIFLGVNSGAANDEGSDNVCLGANSGSATTSGRDNVFVGLNSGLYNETGNYNVALGFNSGPDRSTTGLSNTVALGFNAVVTQSNSIVLGNNASVGIGTSAPNSALQVNGAVSVAYVTASADLTLTSAHYTVRRFGGCNRLTLPNPNTCQGRLYILINSNGTGSNVTLTVAGGGGIYDDVTNASLTALAPNNRITVQSDGSTWLVVGR